VNNCDCDLWVIAKLQGLCLRRLGLGYNNNSWCRKYNQIEISQYQLVSTQTQSRGITS
jgi:hypothetical protein